MMQIMRTRARQKRAKRVPHIISSNGLILSWHCAARPEPQALVLRGRTARAAKSRKTPRGLLPIVPKEILHVINVALKSREPSDYQVSILEVAGSSSQVEDNLKMVAGWKAKLAKRGQWG